MNPDVDWFFNKAEKWKAEYEIMRKICLDTGLTEELKWNCPCYTYRKKNVVLIHGFNHYCALLFHKGALLKDPENILIQQTKNVQSARQLRFTSAQEILGLEPIIKAYIEEAIEVEKAGLVVRFKETEEYSVPEEFQHKLDDNPDLKAAFEALTPGRKRGYLFYFSGAKQAKTRIQRVEKCIPDILIGKGLQD